MTCLSRSRPGRPAMGIPKSVLLKLAEAGALRDPPEDKVYMMTLGNDAWKIYEKWLSGASVKMWICTAVVTDRTDAADGLDKHAVEVGVRKDARSMLIKLAQDHALEMGLEAPDVDTRPRVPIGMSVSVKVALALVHGLSSATEPYETINGLSAGTYICDVVHAFHKVCFNIKICKK